MVDRRAKRTPRSPLAAQIDAMTAAALVVLLGVAAWSAVQFGPSQALDRIGCRINDGVNALLAYPRPCH